VCPGAAAGTGLRSDAVWRRPQDDRSGSEERAGRLTFVCECADRDCTERIQLSASEYAGIRRDPRRFVVVPGHEFAELERVVEAHDGYEVVEKPRA